MINNGKSIGFLTAKNVPYPGQLLLYEAVETLNLRGGGSALIFVRTQF